MGWNSEELRGVFLKGLNKKIKDDLACREDPADFDSLISLTIRLDN